MIANDSHPTWRHECQQRDPQQQHDRMRPNIFSHTQDTHNRYNGQDESSEQKLQALVVGCTGFEFGARVVFPVQARAPDFVRPVGAGNVASFCAVALPAVSSLSASVKAHLNNRFISIFFPG